MKKSLALITAETLCNSSTSLWSKPLEGAPYCEKEHIQQHSSFTLYYLSGTRMFVDTRCAFKDGKISATHSSR